MLKNVDVLIHLSVDDIKFLQEHLPEKPHALSMPAIDETFVSKVNATRAGPPKPLRAALAEPGTRVNNRVACHPLSSIGC